MILKLGKFNEDKLNSIIGRASLIKDIQQKTDFISSYFLDIPYRSSTLIGNKNSEEVFVINLEGMDCFTFIDYVEAMRISSSFEDFLVNVRKLRYKSGKVSFKNRNHFFTDWKYSNKKFIDDVTLSISDNSAICIEKKLNLKENGSKILQGITVIKRKIFYIPVNFIKEKIIDNLKTGDYIGIYSEKEGLDVSHTGIIIRKSNNLFLRHASSQENIKKIIDSNFISYVKKKPGIIVFRPKELLTVASNNAILKAKRQSI